MAFNTRAFHSLNHSCFIQNSLCNACKSDIVAWLFFLTARSTQNAALFKINVFKLNLNLCQLAADWVNTFGSCFTILCDSKHIFSRVYCLSINSKMSLLKPYSSKYFARPRSISCLHWFPITSRSWGNRFPDSGWMYAATASTSSVINNSRFYKLLWIYKILPYLHFVHRFDLNHDVAYLQCVFYSSADWW